jgi:hypothetical protein
VGFGGAPSSTPSASAAPEPVTDAVRDATFALTLTVDRGVYRAGEPITVSASYTYLGPKGTEKVFHAEQAVGFRIEEIGGTRGMGGGMHEPCRFTDVVAGQPVPVPFSKFGAISDVPGAGFDRAWYEDPVLRLPAGSWRIVAYLDAWLGECGGERHALETAVGIAVEP